jgi:hypothetical protein
MAWESAFGRAQGEKCQDQPLGCERLSPRTPPAWGCLTGDRKRKGAALTIELQHLHLASHVSADQSNVHETLDTIASKVSSPGNRDQIFEMAQQLRQWLRPIFGSISGRARFRYAAESPSVRSGAALIPWSSAGQIPAFAAITTAHVFMTGSRIERYG